MPKKRKSSQEDTEAVLIRSAAEAIPEVLAQSRRDHVELLHVNCEGCEYDALLLMDIARYGKRLQMFTLREVERSTIYKIYKPTINHPYILHSKISSFTLEAMSGLHQPTFFGFHRFHPSKIGREYLKDSSNTSCYQTWRFFFHEDVVGFSLEAMIPGCFFQLGNQNVRWGMQVSGTCFSWPRTQMFFYQRLPSSTNSRVPVLANLANYSSQFHWSGPTMAPTSWVYSKDYGSSYDHLFNVFHIWRL